tara:strand:- start:461 stop:685 length:225 start_codon:yes stop_codon:yes gene_type:complete
MLTNLPLVLLRDVAGSQGNCCPHNHFFSPSCGGDANVKRRDFSFSFLIRGKHIYVLPIQANWNRQMLNQTAMGK